MMFTFRAWSDGALVEHRNINSRSSIETIWNWCRSGKPAFMGTMRLYRGEHAADANIPVEHLVREHEVTVPLEKRRATIAALLSDYTRCDDWESDDLAAAVFPEMTGPEDLADWQLYEFLTTSGNVKNAVTLWLVERTKARIINDLIDATR